MQAARPAASLDDHDPGAVRTEAGTVRRADRHGQRHPFAERQASAEGLLEGSADDDGQVGQVGLERGLDVAGREAQLSDREAVHVGRAQKDSFVLDDRCEARHIY